MFGICVQSMVGENQLPLTATQTPAYFLCICMHALIFISRNVSPPFPLMNKLQQENMNGKKHMCLEI